MPSSSRLAPKKGFPLSRSHCLSLALVFFLFVLTGLLSAQQEIPESQDIPDLEQLQEWKAQFQLFPPLDSLAPNSFPSEEETDPALVYHQQLPYAQGNLISPTPESIAQAKADILAQAQAEAQAEAQAQTQAQTLPQAPTGSAPSPIAGADSQVEISLLRSATGAVESLSMDVYLWGVLAAEMPASFPLEALKAQAVAGRSYTIQRLTNPKHTGAQICDSPACCQAYTPPEQRLSSWGSNASFYQEKITSAIVETDGLYVLYQGQPINALFFSSSWGQTLPSQEVWGGTVDYLRSVPSPESQIQDQIPSYHHQVSFSAQEVSAKLGASYPAIDFSASPDSWFTQRVNDSVGGVGQYTVGGVTLTGTQIRAVFALRSTYFTIYYNEGEFTFSTTGYGHNVGMSQYGAKALAESGYHFAQILSWYYTGTTVRGYTP